MAHRRKNNTPQYLIVVLVVLIFYVLIHPFSATTIAVIALIFAACVLYFSIKGRYLWEKYKKMVAREKRAERAQLVYRNGQLDFLDPYELEKYVAGLFKKIGYKADPTKKSGDGGIDVIAKQHQTRIAIQVKKLKGNVGRPDLQKLVGASRGYDYMICVSTSGYSIEAKEYAKDYINMRLIDGDDLHELSEIAFGKEYVHKALSAKNNWYFKLNY